MTLSLLQRHQPTDCVAFGAGGVRSAADLLRDAATIARALPEARPDSSMLMVFKTDRYAFTAALLGAWAAGHSVTLPPNQRGTTVIELLSRSNIAGLLHDTQAGGHFGVGELLRGEPAKPLSRAIVPSGVIAHAMTSGSTGTSQAWSKTGDQLAETALHAETFGLQPGQFHLATVPPTHLYGLLFGVLLPLASGGAFMRETPLHSEAIASRLRQHAVSVLVSVPVHLRAALTVASGAFSSVQRVFSSTGPLHESTAKGFVEQHGKSVTEIFGSTETGGIAWRERTKSEAWHPFSVVKVSANDEGRLLVDSPFLGPGATRPFETADSVDMQPDGTFIHRGRHDGVVKVGGLRVSLPALEEWLQQYPGVNDCVVVAAPELARGFRVLAAVVASASIEAGLRTAMAERFDPSTLPKRILFVDRLPREANGKLQKERVFRLFGLDAEGAPFERELSVGQPVAIGDDPLPGATAPGAEQVDAARLTPPPPVWHVAAQVSVPENYLGFSGHFDGYPVMAGVVQLHDLLMPLIAHHRPDLGHLRGLRRVKFLGRIGPGDSVEVKLGFPATDAGCDFQISKDGSVCSAGRLDFDPNGATLPPDSLPPSVPSSRWERQR